MTDYYPADYCPCVDYPESCTLGGAAWCVIHGEHELPDENTYRVCFECGHVYQTEQDLVDAYEREVEAMNHADHVVPLSRFANEIHFCQECLHDW